MTQHFGPQSSHGDDIIRRALASSTNASDILNRFARIRTSSPRFNTRSITRRQRKPVATRLWALSHQSVRSASPLCRP